MHQAAVPDQAPVPRRTRDARRRVFVVLNPVMRFLLRLPWRTPMHDRLLLLTFTGRKTGKRYSIPISYMEHTDGSLLAPGGGAWKWNLGEGREVSVLLRGRTRRASSEIIRDPSEIERLLPAMASRNPRVETFTGVPIDADGQPNPGRLRAALDDGFTIVRLRLDDAPPPVTAADGSAR
jgi:deazaflavin-dependent oxidoreductase (nitroreductase family)